MDNATCSIDGCPDPVKVKSRGWCNKHYQRWYKHGDPLEDHRSKVPSECLVEDCIAQGSAGFGLCGPHYHRQKRYGDPLGSPSPRLPEVCSIDGCDGEVRGRGWCFTHWKRWRKYGDPRGRDAAERMQSTDKWKPTPGFEGLYEVSNRGRVFTLRTWKFMRPTAIRGGYLRVGLHKNGENYNFQVHVLVLLAFAGPRPEGMETRHLDGNPANNRWAPGDEEETVANGGNLIYGTPFENTQDRYRHGTHPALSPPTHCPQNHLYDEENTYIHPRTGHRSCRACARIKAREYKRNKRERQQQEGLAA